MKYLLLTFFAFSQLTLFCQTAPDSLKLEKDEYINLKNIEASVLVMAGEKDMILEKHTKFIADNIPKSQHFIFKGASHYVPVENPVKFNKEVLSLPETR